MKALKIILASLCFTTLLPTCLKAARQDEDGSKAARKFSEYRYGVGSGRASNDCDVDAYLDNFAHHIKAEPGARGYMISYRGRGKPPRYFAFNPRWQHEVLMSEWGFEEGRVVLVYGGHREEATMELWIVPEGAEAPKPSPTTVPKKKRKT